MNKDMISVAEGFQTSINIAYDLYDEDKIKGFIPTLSSIEVLEEILLTTADNSTQRARMFVGAYGRGKSHIILMLLALLRIKDKTIFKTILEKVQSYNPNFYQFVNEYIKGPKKILPIVVSTSGSNLSQAFLAALKKALSDSELSDLMPETHFVAAANAVSSWKNNYPETYEKFIESINMPIEEFLVNLKEFDGPSFELFQELYPKLTSGSLFNPFLGFDVVDLYEKVVEELKKRGYSGVFIVYDEFSKYLESSINKASLSDIKLLQDFAEKCNRSGKNQMHLVLISHKDIANYIDDKLPKEKVDGWRGVSGRFKHISLHNNFPQMYEIISAVILKESKKWNKFEKDHENKFKELALKSTSLGFLDEDDKLSTQVAIHGCYPLHPMSTFILPRISEKIAQNERTLFTFLSSEEKHTLSTFLHTRSESAFDLLTPDYLYDYFEPLLRKEAFSSPAHKQYKLTEKILHRVEENSLASKIIKMISLIYIIEQFEKMPPVIDVIIAAYQESVDDIKVIIDTIQELKEQDCIIYLKRSNNYLKLKESSGIDIQNEIARKVESFKARSNVTNILNDFSFNNFLYPTRYNDEKEITRYFDFIFLSSVDFWNVIDWNRFIDSTKADGIVFALVAKSETDIVEIKKYITSMEKPSNRIIFIVPNEYSEIDEIAFEYSAVSALKLLASDDAILSDEYDIYIEDLEEVLSNYINLFTRPELGKSSYYFENNCYPIMRKAQLSQLLSRVCDRLFPNTPVINNESINKNILPTVAINSRTKLLNGLLANPFEANLGLSGSGQDVSIMRSTLIQTGLLTNVKDDPQVLSEIKDEHFSRLISIIRTFFTNSTDEKSHSIGRLYEKLTLADEYGIGLKKGVIPIYIAFVLHQCKQNIVILNNNQEMKLTADLLNSINENPWDYSLIYVNWDDDKRHYMKGLESVFADYILEKEKGYNSFSYLLLAMNRWYMSLPKYTKEIENTYKGKDIPKEKIAKEKRKFINSLKRYEPNAREYLFDKLPSIFNHKECDLSLVDKIYQTKSTFDQAMDKLIEILILDVKDIFTAKTSKSSLCSLAKDWYEKLTTATTNHLFASSENRILDVFRFIESDDTKFIESLAKATTALRIEDWDAKMIDSFIKDFASFKKNIDLYDLNEDAQRITSDQYRIIFVDRHGKENTKSFNKTVYSPRAKLLLNEVTNAIDEMGEAITEQEKRQVLIELLEKMC